jgi:hypothetical protein
VDRGTTYIDYLPNGKIKWVQCEIKGRFHERLLRPLSRPRRAKTQMDPFCHPWLCVDRFHWSIRFPVRDCAYLPVQHANARHHVHDRARKVVRKKRSHLRFRAWRTGQQTQKLVPLLYHVRDRARKAKGAVRQWRHRGRRNGRTNASVDGPLNVLFWKVTIGQFCNVRLQMAII